MATADAEQPSFCTSPCTSELMNAACQECGHLVALHVGVEHCPVCELLHLNQQAREASVTFEQVARGEKTINDYRAARGLPPFPAESLTVNVHGDAPTEAALRRIVVKQARRGGPGRA